MIKLLFQIIKKKYICYIYIEREHDSMPIQMQEHCTAAKDVSTDNKQRDNKGEHTKAIILFSMSIVL